MMKANGYHPHPLIRFKHFLLKHLATLVALLMANQIKTCQSQQEKPTQKVKQARKTMHLQDKNKKKQNGSHRKFPKFIVGEGRNVAPGITEFTITVAPDEAELSDETKQILRENLTEREYNLLVGDD